MTFTARSREKQMRACCLLVSTEQQAFCNSSETAEGVGPPTTGWVLFNQLVSKTIPYTQA